MMADFEVDLGAATFDILNSIEFEVDRDFSFQRSSDDFVFVRPTDDLIFVREH